MKKKDENFMNIQHNLRDVIVAYIKAFESIRSGGKEPNQITINRVKKIREHYKEPKETCEGYDGGEQPPGE